MGTVIERSSPKSAAASIFTVVALMFIYSISKAVSLSAHTAKLPPAVALAPTLNPSKVSVSPVAVSLFLYPKIVVPPLTLADASVADASTPMANSPSSSNSKAALPSAQRTFTSPLTKALISSNRL